MPATKMQNAIRLRKRRGTLRQRDLVALGIPADYLDRLYRRGFVERVARGVYTRADIDVTEYHSLVKATRAVPTGVICLISALQFHGLTTQIAHEVWMALPNKAWVPKLKTPKLRVVRFSGPALKKLFERHKIEHTTVQVYSPAKTVADCFKFRNTVGLDVALDAHRVCGVQPTRPWPTYLAAGRCRKLDTPTPPTVFDRRRSRLPSMTRTEEFALVEMKCGSLCDV